MTHASSAAGGIHLPHGQGTSYWLLTDLFTFKAVGAETGGAYVLAEVTARPEMGPPPHVHRDADESFYVLEGTWAFSLAGEEFTAGPGAFVHLPKGVVHTHRTAGNEPARAVVLQVPAGVEHFIEEAGVPAGDPSKVPGMPSEADLVRVVQVALKYGIEVPG